MAVALVLIGMFVLISYQAQKVSHWLRQRVGEVELFLEEMEEPFAQALYERASATPGVVEAEYVTREEAQAIFKSEFGEEAEIFFDEQFLPASIKVRVASDYSNADSLQALVAEFTAWNRVDEVVFNQPLLLKVQQNLRLLTLIGLAIGTLVVLASIFLVANTIRLTIYARRLLIRTMKLVGATDNFVRRPFVVEGMLQGLVAGLLAATVLWGLYKLMAAYLPQFGSGSMLAMLVMFVLVGGSGILLGWAGSFLSVRRFIRNVALH
jgi:cell division transport system permease protein